MPVYQLLLNNFLFFINYGYFYIFLEKYFILFRGWPQPILLNELENEFKKAKEIVEPWKWINKEDNSEFENEFRIFLKINYKSAKE